MPIPAKTAKYLVQKELAPKIISHRTVFTAYDLAQTLHRPLETIAKTLLIKTKQGFTLLVLAANARLDFKKLKALLKEPRLSIATEKDMVNVFKVKPGAMTAFGGLHKVPVVLDAAFTKTKSALFPTGSFTDSFEINLKHFLRSEQPLVGRCSVKSDLKLQPKLKKKVAPKHKKSKSKSSRNKKPVKTIKRIKKAKR
jgi:prolyl-tRNA editing enzyme YbaK/EbsC (Cys-tRNA(Pro) deacylase)